MKNNKCNLLVLLNTGDLVEEREASDKMFSGSHLGVVAKKLHNGDL